jgi:hypothetical protein
MYGFISGLLKFQSAVSMELLYHRAPRLEDQTELRPSRYATEIERRGLPKAEKKLKNQVAHGKRV